MSIDEAREAPNLRSLIYWNHLQPLNAELEFVTSDQQGDFLIEVKGYSENGQRLFGTQKFTVKY